MPRGLPAGSRIVLHVGCGRRNELTLPRRFKEPGWREVRLDIDAAVEPDIVGSIVDMPAVPSQSVDAVWSSHNIEHVYAHEVPLVLGEFFRVLQPGGYALIATPDLQRVAECIARGQLDEPLYRSPAGLIAPLDVVYGYGAKVAEEAGFMAHKTGFTARSLASQLRAAGFQRIDVQRQGRANLWAIGHRVA